MREDIYDFQNAGDICENCQERWEDLNRHPIALVALPSYTMRYHSPVAVCPFCDGGEIVKIANKKHGEKDAVGG